MRWNGHYFLIRTTKQFDNLGGFKSGYLFNVWGEGSLAKSEGLLAAPLLYQQDHIFR